MEDSKYSIGGLSGTPRGLVGTASAMGNTLRGPEKPPTEIEQEITSLRARLDDVRSLCKEVDRNSASYRAQFPKDPEGPAAIPSRSNPTAQAIQELNMMVDDITRHLIDINRGLTV